MNYWARREVRAMEALTRWLDANPAYALAFRSVGIEGLKVFTVELGLYGLTCKRGVTAEELEEEGFLEYILDDMAEEMDLFERSE